MFKNSNWNYLCNLTAILVAMNKKLEVDLLRF